MYMNNPTNALAGIRRIAYLGSCYLAMAFAGLGLIQIFLAGSGVFGRDFDMHVVVGRILSGLAILILVMALVARNSKRDVISALIVFLLAGIGTTALANLGSESKWLGGLHALIGLLSVITAEQMGRRVFKSSKTQG